MRASLSFLRYKPELIVLPYQCCGTQDVTGWELLSTMSVSNDLCLSLTTCYIKFTATEKGNDKVCDTHNEACITLTKSITSFEAGCYSSKTVTQQ